MAACPYGARSLNWVDPRPSIKTELNREYPTRTRVVENTFAMKAQRAYAGCVDACKEYKALVFGNLEEIRDQRTPSQNVIRRKPH
jgi:molybdopterin-containing oxidoreductase family iron-sulfur binding subunit